MTAVLHRFLHNVRATAAMEFTFILPVVLALVAGMVEFGRWFQAYNGVNRLATRYATVYSDCNDNPSNLPTSPQACNTELALYWPATAIKNIAPQLTNGAVTVRMFQVQYSNTGTATVVYSYPAGATMSAAETQAGTNMIYNAGLAGTGVIATVQYSYAAVFFPQLFQQMVPSANLNLSYTVAQRKT